MQRVQNHQMANPDCQNLSSLISVETKPTDEISYLESKLNGTILNHMLTIASACGKVFSSSFFFHFFL